MKHEQYLVELLRPLGVYDLRKTAINRGELAACGKALDAAFERLEGICREMLPITAEDLGLERIRELLAYCPVDQSGDGAGDALAALLRIGADSFTPDAVNDTLKGCGVNACAAETDRPGCVVVSFPELRGVPGEFERLREIIEEILPCHVEITYRFCFNTWTETAQFFPTWADAAALGTTWQQAGARQV